MNESLSRQERPRGRRPEGDTRGDILRAARALFASRGYRGTTTRSVAEEAGVDVALIHHFFQSKAGLFAQALELPQVAARVSARLTDPEGDVADGIARLYLDELYEEHGDSFAALLRAVLGSPLDVPELRRMAGEQMVAVVARALGGPEAELRAELVAAQLIGILVLRRLLGIEPIASASTDELRRHLVPALRAYMSPPPSDGSE